MPVPAHDFRWAVGIEDTFIPQLARTTGRALDEYALTQHYDRWREDLALVASLGVRHLRYGIPWYRVNPAPGRFDWSWTDEVLEHMVGRLGLTPIIDLVHYGCPLWLEREFLNPGYPERVAEYAARFVERYRELTRLYTPLNEPLVNLRFCGYTGQWPPYLRGWRGYVRLMLGLAAGMQRTVRAIREGQPGAEIVHVEAVGFIDTDDDGLRDVLAFTRARQYLPTDMLLGRVDARHPLTAWLVEHGAPEAALAALAVAGEDFDVLGINFYPDISCSRLVPGRPPATRRRFRGGPAELAFVIREWQWRYGKPAMITETSTVAALRGRARWMDDSIGVVRSLREQGIPLIGYTWWPLFSLVAWSWRRGRLGLTRYISHMGLWELHDDGRGALRRERTELVDRFIAHIAEGPGRAVAPPADEGGQVPWAASP